MTPAIAIAPVIKRSITIDGHKTSISLEDPFWNHLHKIARRDNKPIAAIVKAIDMKRPGGNLSSALRQLVLANALAAPTSVSP